MDAARPRSAVRAHPPPHPATVYRPQASSPSYYQAPEPWLSRDIDPAIPFRTLGTFRRHPPACTRRSRSAAQVVGRGAGTDKWLVLGFIVHGGTRKPDLAIPEQQGRGDGRRGGAHVSAGHENRSCRFKVFAKLHVCPSAWCHWEAVQISAAQEREGCEVVTRRST